MALGVIITHNSSRVLRGQRKVAVPGNKNYSASLLQGSVISKRSHCGQIIAVGRTRTGGCLGH